MSKKRKKHSQKKKQNTHKNQSLSRSDKKKNRFSFHTVKDFFNDNWQKLKNISFSGALNTSKNYIMNHRKGVIFSLAMTMIVAVFYFTVVYQPAEIAPVVSVNLNEEQTSFMDVVEDEINDVQVETQTVKLSLNESQPTELTTTTEDSELTEGMVEPSIEVITSAEVTGDKVSLAVVDDQPVFDSVSKSMMVGIDMYAILVDNVEVAYFETEREAEEILNALKSKYLADDAVEERVIFRESIAIKQVKRDIFECNGFQTPEEIMEYIVKGTNEQRLHVVEKGENFWVIAEEYELNVQDLIDANPGIDEKRLQIGTELSLIVAEPIINVVTISTVERIDPVPYGREANVLTDKYYEGEYKTKQAGKHGEAEVIVEMYMENGKLIGEKVLEQSVITEPVNQIVYQGTKPAPPKIGTGTYKNPTSRGYITSKFGPRSLGYHTGIDIGIPSRTEVYAADGGIVTYSGYKGTYGKLIIINHGANKETRYAHNSSLIVSSGEKVFKGQLIALSGSTGRSTGPHLHFEIRVNNNPINPINYVSY